MDEGTLSVKNTAYGPGITLQYHNHTHNVKVANQPAALRWDRPNGWQRQREKDSQKEPVTTLRWLLENTVYSSGSQTFFKDVTPLKCFFSQVPPDWCKTFFGRNKKCFEVQYSAISVWFTNNLVTDKHLNATFLFRINHYIHGKPIFVIITQ